MEKAAPGLFGPEAAIIFISTWQRSSRRSVCALYRSVRELRGKQNPALKFAGHDPAGKKKKFE